MPSFKTIDDLDIKDKIILVRTDYNVPLDPDGEIVDDLRIRASLPTLEYLFEKGAKKLILISHLGRPEEQDPQLSLEIVSRRLQELLPAHPIFFETSVSGEKVSAAVDVMPAGGTLLLENLRFWPGEKANDSDFAQQIVAATRADAFIQDGFAVIHRAHASTSAITKLLPSAAGLLLQKEVSTLRSLTTNPAHPFAVIIGGAKVADKQPLIEKFLPLADSILVGGKIAADGYHASSDKIYVAEDFSSPAKEDLGPLATRKFLDSIKPARTVLWNGTLGQVEKPAFAAASTALAEAIGRRPDLTSIICGGDTTAFVEGLQQSHPDLHYTLISTCGGAALALLAGEPLPGLEALASSSA